MTREDLLPVSAIVASHNQAHLLPRCLAALTFCEELIVVDIDSTDDTAAVARRAGAAVVSHPYVTIADEARPEVVASARHDWVLLRDPDEIIPAALRAQVVETFRSLGPAVGLVTGPIQYYFDGRPLRGTVWGGVQFTRILARRDLVEFPTTVHGKLVRKPGCRDLAIPFTGDNAIVHLWAEDYSDLFEKHRRYVPLEGAARAAAEEVTSVRRTLTAPLSEFYRSFIGRGGYKDGLTGFALSLLWGFYRAAVHAALLRERCRQRRA